STQLRKFAFKVIYSTTKLLPAWNRRVAEHKLSERLMPQDVATQWNSMFDMLEFVFVYRKPIDTMCSDRAMGLREFEMAEGEWVIACQLRDILKDATLFFSHATLNLATVIPAMDLIDETLTTASLDVLKYNASIRASIGLAKKTLNQYYDMTDWSELYCIAMVLHPCHKLDYFKTARWEPSWITTAKDIVCTEYQHLYALDDSDDLEERTKPIASVSNTFSIRFYSSLSHSCN
ncbi:hypothetical protein JAAARDRAFT_132751, partial [Jaapia argillacea MUCL 33604]